MRPEVDLRQPDAVPALTDWPVHSKRGGIGHLQTAQLIHTLEFCVYSLFLVQVNTLSVLQQGVDRKQAFYVLDPDGNLEESRGRFKEWFTR